MAVPCGRLSIFSRHGACGPSSSFKRIVSYESLFSLVALEKRRVPAKV
jgi:hypothetical protein